MSSSGLVVPVEARPPAPAYLNGAGSPDFYLAGRAVRGRPYVMVHQGDRARACVGPFSAVGPDVTLLVGGNHRIDWVTTFAVRELYDLPGAYEGNPLSRGDIVIGPDVSIGRGSLVLSGVTIGAGSDVAPYSVVTKDVRPCALVAGNPARELTRRFSDEDVDQLLDLAWWSWPAERILRELKPPEDCCQLLRAELDARQTKARRPLMRWQRTRLLAGWALRGVAVRIDPPGPEHLPNDFPVHPASHPPSVLEMGWGVGGSHPVIHHDGSGRTRAKVGNYCSLAFDAELVLDGAPPRSPLSRIALGLEPDAASSPSAGDITIGSDVWLTRGAKVLSGVTIGHGAVIGAYAVVTEDVRPFAIVAGNPARETSRRFDDDIVEALLEVAWWEWPEEVVRARWEDLASSDVRAFVERYRPRV